MPFTLTMPKLSPTMEEGTIAKWRKKEGDYVKAGDVLFEVATDKATVEHSALDEGFLRKILVPEGKSAIVNQAIAIFTLKKEESIEGYKPEGEVPKAVPKGGRTFERGVRLLQTPLLQKRGGNGRSLLLFPNLLLQSILFQGRKGS